MTAYIRQRRQLPKRASSQAVKLDERQGKSAFRRGVVPADVRKRYVDLAKSITAEQQQGFRRRRRDAAFGTAASTVGLVGAAAFGAAQIKRGRVGAAIQPFRSTLERTALGTAVGGGALGGYSGIRGANTQRKIINEEERNARLGIKKSMPTGLSVPRGLRQRKTYTASSIRATPTGRLVRTRAGVR